MFNFRELFLAVYQMISEMLIVKITKQLLYQDKNLTL
jgi:hypothetical protein